jgi:uncharacterized membrane protein
MLMRPLFVVLVTLFSLTYPLLVYFGVGRVGPAFFALIAGVIAALKFAAAKDKKDAFQIVILTGVMIFSVALVATNSELLLRLYPVMMSVMVALIFLSSLRQPENILLRGARLAGKTISAGAQRYTQVLTLVWALVLLANALVALYFALFATLGQWAFYCGFLSYVILATLFAGELVYRRYYISKQKKNAAPDR